MNKKIPIALIVVIMLFSGSFVYSHYFRGDATSAAKTTLKYVVLTNSSSVPDTGFVVFNGYKVSTNDASVAKTYLSIWKKDFQRENKMSDTYFNSHIIVVGCETNNFSRDNGNTGKTFYVRYQWQFDWAKANQTDYFDYYFDGVGALTDDKSRPDDSISFTADFTDISQLKQISIVQPISKIATKDQIESAIRKVVSVNAEYTVMLTGWYYKSARGGKIIADVVGVIDNAKNECIHASISLEKAEVISVVPDACRI